ncbi:MAG: ShlB/FhaC/HecB family hemolysin secretion/activation protein [Bacteroidales bacterium]|nr:ShlB/FhaC/HecB family hemolysin secretion/activation protein [Bacteroidales bacterium]
MPYAGYYYGSINAGGFIENQEIRQGTVRLNIDYFTQLLRTGQMRFRVFVKSGYTVGYNRFSDEFITIKNTNGVRGLKSDSLIGTEKITLNLETVAFTPVYFYGFRLSAFAGADFGLVTGNQSNLLRQKVYSSYSIGFRLKNERLVFPTIQFRFAYYPAIPPGAIVEPAKITGETRLKLQDFYIKMPEIEQYK